MKPIQLANSLDAFASLGVIPPTEAMKVRARGWHVHAHVRVHTQTTSACLPALCMHARPCQLCSSMLLKAMT